jgi:hypothetical protein
VHGTAFNCIANVMQLKVASKGRILQLKSRILQAKVEFCKQRVEFCNYDMQKCQCLSGFSDSLTIDNYYSKQEQ